MSTFVEGFPAPLPFGIDFVTYSNEDVGYTAAYAAGTDVYQFPLPYPSSMNLWEETLMLFAMEFIHQTAQFSRGSLVTRGLMVHLSMLADDFGPNWGGILADAEDEAFKSMFAGPFYFGEKGIYLTDSDNAATIYYRADKGINVLYYPPEPLDLVTPLYVNLTNSGGTVTLATLGSVLDDDMNITEEVAFRVWFIKRDYTAMEKAFLNRLPTRFQQLDS